MSEMFFEQNVIRNILNNTNIINLLRKESNVLISKKDGVFYADECPFCHSTNRSLMLDTVNARYICLHCGRGGNVIDFIMRYKNLSFVDAVTYLSKECNVSTNKPVFEDKTISPKAQTLLKINQLAAKFYFDQLRTDVGIRGMKYFNDRGVSPYIKSFFGLGYAGPFGDTLYQFLKSHGFEDADILETGLVGKSTKNNAQSKIFYDKFSNRVIFPILNAKGQVVAFGGRILGDEKPKYLNSQETPVFSKKENLYCYNIAKNSKLPYFICCEGYMDAMSLHQYGFDCAVASLGTALTREQIQLLSTKKEIILAYDSDEAGIRAAKRAITLCREVGIVVRVLRMQGAKDPDEFLKKYGSDEFAKLIKNAETDKHFLIRNSKTENGKFNFDEIIEELF
jgi:DNA primase